MTGSEKITKLDAITLPAIGDVFAGVQGGENYKWLTSQIQRTPVDMYNAKHYGATGDGVTDDAEAIQEAIAAASAAGGGEVYIPAGKYLLSESLMLKIGVSIRGVYPGVTSTYPDHWDNGWVVDTGTVLTFPGGIVFQHTGTIDGAIIEKLGFDDVDSVITSGVPNVIGLGGCVIRDCFASNVTGVAYDLINPMHLHMSNVKAAYACQFLRITNEHDNAISTTQPGNSYFEDLYALITAAGHPLPSIHIRSPNTSGDSTPMNYLYFSRVQVNKFLAVDNVGNHLRVEADNLDVSITACTFDHLNLEGPAEHRIYLENVVRSRLNFAGHCIAGDADADFYIRTSSVMVDCPSPAAVLDMDDSNVYWSGAMKDVTGSGHYPAGIWYDLSNVAYRLGLDIPHESASTIKYGMHWQMPDSYLEFPNGGGIRQHLKISGAATETFYRNTIGFIQATKAGDQAFTLPDATDCDGQSMTLKKTASGGTATLIGAGGQTIDGAATNIWLDAQYKYITLQSDGSNWLIVAQG